MKIGIIGGGLAVRDLHVPALRKLGWLSDVHMLATSSLESSTSSSEYVRGEGGGSCRPGTVDSLLQSDIDVVLVAVPISLTDEMVRRSLEAGKHVLAEKPIATSSTSAGISLAMAREQGLALLAGENFRFQTRFARMRDLAESGVIGKIFAYGWNDLHFTPSTGKYAATAWRVAGRHPGGYLIDGGTHIVAGFRQLLSSRVRELHANSAATQHYLSGQADTLLINLKCEDGTIATLSLGYGLFDPESRHPKIYGESGTLILVGSEIHLADSNGVKVCEVVVDPDESGGFEGEWQLIEGVVSGSRPIDDVYSLTEESIADLKLIELAIESSKSRSVCGLL